jgi:hypothetical protein
MQYKAPTSPKFQALSSSGANNIIDSNVTIAELPTVLQLSLDQIIPNNPRATKNVFIDGIAILSTDNKLFETTISNPDDHEIKIVVEDKSTQAKSEKIINVKTKRDNIIGRLIVRPDSVGTDPFTVTLDVSTTTLNDPTDQIVYFTWDFGDGT